MERELLQRPKHPSSTPILMEFVLNRSLVFCVVRWFQAIWIKLKLIVSLTGHLIVSFFDMITLFPIGLSTVCSELSKTLRKD
jgi:hypothetical protein